MQNLLYLDMALLALLFFASVYDLAQRRIPNRLLCLGLICALTIQLYSGPLSLVWTHFLPGFAIGMLLFFPLHIAKAMAAGDVKLMATVGAFTGPAMVWQICLATYCIGGLMALVMVLAMGRGRDAFVNVGAVIRPALLRMCGIPAVTEPMPRPSVGGMPYAVAISFGTLLILCLGHG